LALYNNAAHRVMRKGWRFTTMLLTQVFTRVGILHQCCSPSYKWGLALPPSLITGEQHCFKMPTLAYNWMSSIVVKCQYSRITGWAA
jgi:hypothetical protein